MNIKKVMSKTVYVLFQSLTSLTYIALQPLGVFWSIFDVFNIDSIKFKENENDISDIFDMSDTIRITM